MEDENDRENVRSLERGFDVIRSFDANHARMTLSEVAERAGLTRATARRFLLTLIRLDVVGTDGKLFWLQPRILDLGYRYLSGLPWWETAQPVIEDVTRQLRESSSISVVDGHEIVYVSRAHSTRLLAHTISIGSRFPAFCTAMGRAILAHETDDAIDAFLASAPLTRFTERTVTDPRRLRKLILECRSRGYALSDEELDHHLRGLAVPIRDQTGRVVASLGISVYAGGESTNELVKRSLPALLEGAARITKGMLNQGFNVGR
jgi:IclR family pca regulon transcriptional regulator